MINLNVPNEIALLNAEERKIFLEDMQATVNERAKSFLKLLKK